MNFYLIFHISRRSIRLILLLSLSYTIICFHISFHVFSYTIFFIYLSLLSTFYPFRVLYFVLSIYCIHVLFLYYFHIPSCSFHILFFCITFHMIVIYCVFHLILSYTILSYAFHVLYFVLYIYCIHVLFLYYFHISIFMYCSFPIFPYLVYFHITYLILSYCTSLYFHLVLFIYYNFL